MQTDGDLKATRKSVIDGMLDYMVDGETGYEKSHVEECNRILEQHLDALAGASDCASALECVKVTVLRLNDLNGRAGHELIETGQREEICEYISRAGSLLGFHDDAEDVTEPWREW